MLSAEAGKFLSLFAMNNFYFETYHLWHPDFRQALSYAIAHKCAVSIYANMSLDECNKADLELKGRFVGFSGSYLQFVVESFMPELASNFPAAPECEYSFKAASPMPENVEALLEYGGRAYIIDQELQANDIPESLLLRLSPPSRLRRMRQHGRVSNPGDIILMPGLLLMDEEPINRRRLLALLGYYYRQKERPRPTLVDISAGGACLETADPHCLRFMGTEESFLFFFFSEKDGVLDNPHVFMARKVGILRDEKSQHTGLRIKFLRELVWTGPNEELKWRNIEFSGSEKIKELFDTMSVNLQAPTEIDRGNDE